jgi:hypothetical protein
MNDSAAVVVVEPPADRPIRLVGAPQAVAADVTVYNPRNRSLVLRDVGLRELPDGLAQVPARHGTMPTVLRPRQQRKLHIAIALPATTPAGEYRGKVDIMGETRDAVLHVTETVGLRVEPDTLWVVNDPSRGQIKRLTITNEGNVEAVLGDIRDVGLKDDLTPPIDSRLVLQALAHKPDLGPDEMIDALLIPLRRGDGPTVGSVSVEIIGGPATIAPSETRTVEVQVTLPEPPPPNGRYRARVPVLTETLAIVVIPSETAARPPDQTESDSQDIKAASTQARRKRGRS